MRNKQIAAELDASEATVKMHRSQVMKKMQAKSLPELIGHGYFLQKSVLAIPERLSHPPSTPRVSNSKDQSGRWLRAPRICSSRLQEIGFIHREVNLYIAQKICLGHSDGKTFECGKFLKHSLQ